MKNPRGIKAAEDIQQFINGYGFKNFTVYGRTDNWLAIDVDGENESEIYSLLYRLHAWNLNADLYEHYIEINIESDDRW